jgi:hypothetical protein
MVAEGFGLEEPGLRFRDRGKGGEDKAAGEKGQTASNNSLHEYLRGLLKASGMPEIKIAEGMPSATDNCVAAQLSSREFRSGKGGR